MAVAGFLLSLVGEDMVPEQTGQRAQASEEAGGDAERTGWEGSLRGAPPGPAHGRSGRGCHVTRRTLGAMVRISAPVRWGPTSVTSCAQSFWDNNFASVLNCPPRATFSWRVGRLRQTLPQVYVCVRCLSVIGFLTWHQKLTTGLETLKNYAFFCDRLWKCCGLVNVLRFCRWLET